MQHKLYFRRSLHYYLVRLAKPKLALSAIPAVVPITQLEFPMGGVGITTCRRWETVIAVVAFLAPPRFSWRTPGIVLGGGDYATTKIILADAPATIDSTSRFLQFFLLALLTAPPVRYR